jgi:HlyD family secretion protein
MNSTNYRILFAGVLIATLVGIGLWLSSSTDADTQPAYSQIKVVRGDIAAVVTATGTLNPVNTVQVGSQVSGTIQHLYADFNDHVKNGQVVAQIEPAVFRAKLSEAEANVKSAQSGVDKAWVSVLDAQRELERQSDLFDKKLVAESVLDAARFAHDSAQVEHQVRKAAVAQAEAARELEQVNLAYTTIYAPIDGVVISRDVDVGQTVAASLQAPTLFTIAKDLTRMQVDADVDESFIGQVHEGQSVRFTVFAYPGREFEGRVAQVRLQPKVESGVVKYNSIIHVDNADMALKPGMTATVSIQVADQKDVLQLPGSAMRFVPDWPQEELAALREGLASDQRIVWALEADGLRPIKVSTGIQGELLVEVRSDELREGMVIAIPEKRKTERKRRFGLSLF